MQESFFNLPDIFSWLIVRDFFSSFAVQDFFGNCPPPHPTPVKNKMIRPLGATVQSSNFGTKNFEIYQGNANR